MKPWISIVELISLWFIDLPIWGIFTCFLIINIFMMYQLAPNIKSISGADLLVGVSSCVMLVLFSYYEIKARRNLYNWVYLKINNKKK